MQGNRKVYKRTFFWLVIFSTLMSFQTHAQVATTQEFDEIEHVVGGDICRAVNVNKAIRSIQYLRGAIVNNSQTESINVTCPITIFPPVEDLLILMTHKPQSSIRCVVRQFSYGEEVSGRIVEQHVLCGNTFRDVSGRKTQF